MKSLAVLAIIILFTALSFFGFTETETKAAKSETANEPVESAASFEEISEHCCECDAIAQSGVVHPHDAAEHEISYDRMVQEVELLWTMWFDDEEASQTDPRRGRFTEFAEYLVDAVIMYRNTPTDIGGILPGHKNDHLIVAYTIARESSVTHDVIGRSHKERGLMQLHGAALAGYSPEKVQHNPRLGILLGVRWLAAQIPKCNKVGYGGIYVDKIRWEDADWIGPLSVYAGGQKAVRKNGRCSRYKNMKQRVQAVRMFRTRIDHKMEYWEE